MTFAHVRIAGPTLAPEQVRRLQHGMTDIMVETLGGEPAAVSVLFEPAPAHGWTVGGSSATILAHVVATTTAGSTASDQKAAFVARSHDLLRRMLGGELTPYSYVVVDERPADAWGYGGVTQAGRQPTTAPAAL